MDSLTRTFGNTAGMEERLNCVGEKVAKRRIALGLSQHQFSLRAQIYGWDIDRKVVSRLELGTRRVTDHEIYYLSELLECPIESLYPAKQIMASHRRSNPPKR